MSDLMPLGKAQTIVEKATDLKVTYAYEDLVFIEHNPFLLRFDEKEASLMFLHFNVQCEEKEAARLEDVLKTAAKDEGLSLKKAEPYELHAPKNKYEIEVRFQV